MGLFKSLVLLPLAPVEGVVWVAQKIQAEVDRQLLDPQVVLRELTSLQADLDEGRITEDEYLAAEDELLDRLEAIEEAR
ncbi:MAG TPA: gas vesicle protein GvpG [Acidimicrobiales bacterium]|nr:gas vesicle protein GvpG [Acidimicrobiales bacterium]